MSPVGERRCAEGSIFGGVDLKICRSDDQPLWIRTGTGCGRGSRSSVASAISNGSCGAASFDNAAWTFSSSRAYLMRIWLSVL